MKHWDTEESDVSSRTCQGHVTHCGRTKIMYETHHLACPLSLIFLMVGFAGDTGDTWRGDVCNDNFKTCWAKSSA